MATKKVKPTSVVHTVSMCFTQAHFDEWLDNTISCLAEIIEYEDGVDSMLSCLSMSREELAANPNVFGAFMADCELAGKDAIDNVDFDVSWTKVATIFSKEVKAYKKIKAEQEKAAKKAAEEERKRIEKEGVQLTVLAVNADKARALLKAAGFLE